MPVNGFDDHLVCRVEPLDQERESSEEEPVNGWDQKANVGIRQVVGMASERVDKELVVIGHGRDSDRERERVQGLEKSGVKRHDDIMVV